MVQTEKNVKIKEQILKKKKKGKRNRGNCERINYGIGKTSKKDQSKIKIYSQLNNHKDRRQRDEKKKSITLTPEKEK